MVIVMIANGVGVSVLWCCGLNEGVGTVLTRSFVLLGCISSMLMTYTSMCSLEDLKNEKFSEHLQVLSTKGQRHSVRLTLLAS